jgi:hypothetical protein
MSGGFVVLYDMGFTVLRDSDRSVLQLNLPFRSAHEADRPPEPKTNT